MGDVLDALKVKCGHKTLKYLKGVDMGKLKGAARKSHKNG